MSEHEILPHHVMWVEGLGWRPRVAGGADEGDQGQGTGTVATEGTDGDQGLPPAGAAEPSGGTGSDSLATGFLSRVPEDQRAIVEPYVQQWDAGVTRRFQELHSRYEPFKTYVDQGVDTEQVQGAMQLYELLNTNPEYVYNLLKTELEGSPGLEQGLPTQATGEDPFQDLPPQFVAKFQEQQQALETMAQIILNGQNETQMQSEDAQLDSYLGLLKTEFGDFDEDYVVAKMARGIDGDVAVRQYQAAVQNFVTQRDQAGQGPGSAAPLVLGGGGGVAQEGTDIRTAPAKEVKGLVAQLLEQSNRS